MAGYTYGMDGRGVAIDIEALDAAAINLGVLLDSIASGELVCSAAYRHRVEGALLALGLVAGHSRVASDGHIRKPHPAG